MNLHRYPPTNFKKTLNWISSMSLLLLCNLYILYIQYAKNRINIYTYASFFEIYLRYILNQFNKILELKVLYQHKCLWRLPPLTKICWRNSNEVSTKARSFGLQCVIRGNELQYERTDCLIRGNELQFERTGCPIRGNELLIRWNELLIRENGLHNSI